MKSFSQHMSEKLDPRLKATGSTLGAKGMSLCELLAGDEMEFIKHYNALNKSYYNNIMPTAKINPSTGNFMKALAQWYDQAAGNKDWFLPILQEAAKCPNRGAWTYYSGKAYRGVLKSLESVNLVLEDKLVNDPVGSGVGPFLVGTATYNSTYPMQSWSARADVTYEFANTNYTKRFTALKGRKQKYPMTFEAELPKEQTFLNPDISNFIGRSTEHEVLRIGNTPIKCKVYIWYDSFERLFWNGFVQTKEAEDLAKVMARELNKKDPKKTKNDKTKKMLKDILSKTLGLGDKGAELLVEAKNKRFLYNITRKMTFAYPDLLKGYPV